MFTGGGGHETDGVAAGDPDVAIRRSHRRCGKGDGDGPLFRGSALHGVPRPPVFREAGGIDPGVQEVDPPRALRPRNLLREPGNALFHERHRLRGSRKIVREGTGARTRREDRALHGDHREGDLDRFLRRR